MPGSPSSASTARPESSANDGWPLAFAAQLWILHRHDEEQPYFDFLHAGQLLLFCALASWELSFSINRAVAASSVWGHIAWALVPASVLTILSARAERLPWPVRGRIPTYMAAAGAPLVNLQQP